MSYPRPIQWYHSRVNLIRPDGLYKRDNLGHINLPEAQISNLSIIHHFGKWFVCELAGFLRNKRSLEMREIVMACPALWKILSINKFVAENRKKRCYHSQADSMLPDSFH
jgi:hypothetical protein